MKNKQVKQMMCSLMSNRDGYDYEWRHYENQGKKNLSAVLFLMSEDESSVVFFGKPISLTAMDHWLFLRNNKIENFFPEQILIGGGSIEFDVNPVKTNYVLEEVVKNCDTCRKQCGSVMNELENPSEPNELMKEIIEMSTEEYWQVTIK